MDSPEMDVVELVPEKEKIEDEKEEGPAFHCDFCDPEIVFKIAQSFLPALATACIDNTTGGVFRSPGSVAVDIRKEMIEYLTQRSESFVAESVVLEGGPEPEKSDDPFDIISDITDDFASSKRNFFSRVSGWLLSEKREDKIDDFMQEIELNGFWLLDRREAIAQILLRNVDFKNSFHCDKKFNTSEELTEHVGNCGFRSMNCTNEGCIAIFSARHMEKHDSVCPFKIIPCEQKCPDNIMRREMDRHCITVCPMKLVNCPFYSVGCQSTVPQCLIQQHRSEDLQSHLFFTLKSLHKGASEDQLKQRVDQIVQASSGRLADAKNMRSLTLKLKDIEAKLGPLEVNTAQELSEGSTVATNNTSEETVEAVNKISEERTEAADNVDDKTTKAMDKDGGELGQTSNEAVDNLDEKTTKAMDKDGGELGQKSNEAADNVDEKTTKAMDKDGRELSQKSNEAADNVDEKTTKAMDKDSGELGHTSNKAADNVDEKTTKAMDKDGGELGGASNLTACTSDEADIQAQT